MKSIQSDIIWEEEVRIQERYAKRNNNHLYSWFNEGHLFFVQQRERAVLSTLKREGLSSLGNSRIFEVGCGGGGWIRDFIRWGALPKNLTAVECLDERVCEANVLCPEGVNIQKGNGAKLSQPSNHYDIVLQSTVFTSVLDLEVKKAIASELMRIVKNDGIILWYDFHVNNPSNPDVKGVGKKEIHHLFPGCSVRLQRITLAPPLYRLIAPFSWGVAGFLERLKVFNTHYLGIIKKES